MSPGNREAVWLPLLVRLTERCPTWSVWKSAEQALVGTDDVDVVAPRAAWPMVEDEFRRWAAEGGRPVVVCRHIPETLNLFAVADGELLQLEVRAAGTFRGSVQFTAADVLRVSERDARGFRRIRPGGEGLLKLTLHGLRRGGRPNPAALSEHGVAALLRGDPEGAAGMAEAFGPARRSVLRAARAAAAGGWDRKALLAVEAWAAARALTQPQVTVKRVWFRRVRRPRCPVLQTVYAHGRVLPEADGQWLARARASGHQVTGPGTLPPTAGRFLVIVGPDGVGKTTVADVLLASHPGETGYVYFRAPLRGSLPARPPTGPRPRGQKHPAGQPQALGWLRLFKNLLWFRLGYLLAVRPITRRGGFVIADRWGYGYAVQPGPLKFFGPDWLGRLGVRAMPHPDLVVNLVAAPDVIVERKDELTRDQAADELDRWARLPVPRLRTVDASPPPDEVADVVLGLLAEGRP